MKTFINYMRHFWLINFYIAKYSCKVISRIFKGDSTFLPSHRVIRANLEMMTRNGLIKPPNMCAYEYDCCVEYLKIIRKNFHFSRKSDSEFSIVFSALDTPQVYIPIYETYFKMVAKECGFDITHIEKLNETYIFTLASNLEDF